MTSTGQVPFCVARDRDVIASVQEHHAKLKQSLAQEQKQNEIKHVTFGLETLRFKFNKLKSRQDEQSCSKTPFDRMQECRDALQKLDNCGWMRSYHQRLFHEDFLVSYVTICVHTLIASCSDIVTFESISCKKSAIDFTFAIEHRSLRARASLAFTKSFMTVCE